MFLIYVIMNVGIHFSLMWSWHSWNGAPFVWYLIFFQSISSSINSVLFQKSILQSDDKCLHFTFLIEISGFLFYHGNQETLDIIVYTDLLHEWVNKMEWVLWRYEVEAVCCLDLCNKLNLDNVTLYNLTVCTWVVAFLKWGFVFSHYSFWWY